MSTADFTIRGDTSLDSAGFEGGLKKISSLSTKVVTAIAGATTAAVTALGGIGMAYNAEMESYISNFKVLLGSAEAAVDKVNEMKEMAAATPFEMSDLASATQTLLQFGVASEKTADIMQMLGDVSLGNADKFRALALVYGQVYSQGKLMGQDLLQMINAGFNPLQVISEQTGKNMAVLKEEMAQGRITIDDVTFALQTATSEGGKFYNGMAEGAKTTKGMISTLKDNVTALIGEVFMPLSTSIQEAVLPATISNIDILTQAYREKGVTGMILAAFDMMSGFLRSAEERAPEFTEKAIRLMTALMQGFISMLPNLVCFAITLVAELARTLLSQAPYLIAAGIQLLASLAVKLIEEGKKLGANIIQGMIDGIGSMAGALWDAAVSVAKRAFDAIRSFFDIRSPSRKMRFQLAPDIPKGMALGITDNAYLVEDAMRSMGQQGYDAIAAGGRYNGTLIMPSADDKPHTDLPQKQGDTINNFNFYQPVETPDETARAIRIQQEYGLAGDY